MQLKKFPDSRVTLRVPPQLKKSPVFPSSSRDEGSFPCFVGKRIPAFLTHFKRRQSQLETREQLHRFSHNSKRPWCPNPLHIRLIPLYWLDCYPENQLNTILACVTALWHLERKPQIPMSSWPESNTTFTAREESWLACLHTIRGLTPLWNSIGTPRSMSAL